MQQDAFWECKTIAECNAFMAIDAQENGAKMFERLQANTPPILNRSFFETKMAIEYLYAREIMGITNKDQFYA